MKKYKTEKGSLYASQFTDEHLKNRIIYEIGKISLAKDALKTPSSELDRFSEIMQRRAPSMDIDIAEHILENIESTLGPLVLEANIRDLEIASQMAVLSSILELSSTVKINKSPTEAYQLFGAGTATEIK